MLWGHLYSRGTGWNTDGYFLSDLYGWDANVTATDNGDGTWSRTVTPAPTSDVNYVWIVDGVQENLLAANAAGCDAFVQGTTFNTDSANYANRLWKVGSGDQSGYYNGCDTANLTSVTFTVTVPGTHTSVTSTPQYKDGIQVKRLQLHHRIQQVIHILYPQLLQQTLSIYGL